MQQVKDTIIDARNLVKRLALAVLALTVVCSMVVAFPDQSYAATTVKCTARPNSDSGNDVQGAKETRITWEMQFAPEESITKVSLTLPAGSSCSTENAAISTISGADNMTRTELDAAFVVQGETITATLSEPAPAGSYVRFVIYGVFFPVEGGDMVCVGNATLANGSTVEISDIPAIPVKANDPVEAFAEKINNMEWAKAWNSNKFLNLFLNPGLLVRSFPIVLKGFLMSLGIVLVSFPCAIPLGLGLALMRLSKRRILRGLAGLYVNVVRGTPLFLQIYVAFFGLPLAGISLPNFPLGVIVLCLNSAAYMCEIFRAGILSIPKGQFEAASSLGMRYGQTMLFIIFPQMVKRVVPTLTSEFILLYKDTSLLAAVGVMEVILYAKSIVATTGSITPYIVAACFYLIITIPLAKVAIILENKLALTDGGMASTSDAGTKKKKSRNLFGFGKKNETAKTVPSSDEVGITGEPLKKAISPDELDSL